MKKIVAQRLIGMLLLSCVQTTCPRPIKIVAYKAKSGNTGGTFFPASGRSMILIGQDVASRNSLNVSAAEFTTTTAASNTTFNNPSDLSIGEYETILLDSTIFKFYSRLLFHFPLFFCTYGQSALLDWQTGA